MVKHPIYDRGTLYLSGSMEAKKDLGLGWRAECSERLKQMNYFPLDIAALDVAYTKAHGELYATYNSEELLQKKSNVRKHFVYTDLQLIMNDSDGLVVLYDEGVKTKSAGTVSECQVAYNHDLPIFIVSAYPDYNKDMPSWLVALSTKIFTSFEDLYTYLDQLPYGIIKRDAYRNHRAGNFYLCSLCGNPFEKHKHHFVSKISPLYCGTCVELVKTTYESHKDRYEFFVEHLESTAKDEE